MSDWLGSALGTGLLVCALFGIFFSVILGLAALVIGAVRILDACVSWVIDRDDILATGDYPNDDDEEEKQL